MQRSRRALLQRRAAAAVALERTKNVEEQKQKRKQKLYKVSLSAAVLLWVLVFLLNSLISHGNGYKDEQYAALAESISEKEEILNVINSTSNINIESTNTAFSETENYQNTDELPANEPEIIPEKREKEGEIMEKEGEIGEKEGETRDIEESETKEEERETNGQKMDRIHHRITPLPLDEFKNKAINSKGKTNSQSGTSGRVVRRVEPGGKEYNYASQSKGAKVLAFNKEAKGASNVLDKDKDKYLRNPCSAEGKFVILELSEETLVDMIVIANFEHYSSNLKQFEVFSSLVYPTEKWDYVGEFVAPNSKHEQRFNLTEPRWARYLKFNFLSHYGSEFYCTLSSIEVYGVDAVERMLETLISDEKSKNTENIEDISETVEKDEHVEKDELSKKGVYSSEDSENDHNSEIKKEPALDQSGKPFSENIIKSVPDQVGRIAGDTVLKVLMQKVQGLDLNFSVLERYLEELNNRYGQIFKDFDADMVNFDLLLDKLKAEVKGLQASKETIVNELGEITDWKLLISKQMEKYLVDSDILRSEVEKVKERQSEMENKGLAVIFVIFIFWSLAIAKLLSGIIARVCKCNNKSTVTITDDDEKFCRTNSAWFLLLLSSSVVAFIMFI